jgi:hypothetical protein
MIKICPADKILNPISNRCVSRTAKIGRDILAQQMKAPSIPVQQPIPVQPPKPVQPPIPVQPPKPVQQPKPVQPPKPVQQPKPVQPPKPNEKKCTDDKILNPMSNRCVSRTSKLGKEIVKQMMTRRMSSPPLKQMTRRTSSSSPLNTSMIEKQKGKVIGRFMQHTKHKRIATFLNTICPKSGVCIAYGTESEKIKKFFNGFVTFDYVTNFVRVGNVSNNGFIYAITYTHRGYSANAILKSALKTTSDNLMYEYAVGRQINQLFYNKFPIFVETYDYYYTHKDYQTWYNLKENNYVGTLKDALTHHKVIDYKISCEQSRYLCILIQHINNAPTLHNMMTNSSFVKNELLTTLYQIYFTLSALKTEFTHYDLHTSNVLIYTPDVTKYIQYHFHTILGETISFKSRHIVKIIDYGRSYIDTTTTDIKTNVCAETKCGGPKKCGDDYGYWLKPPTIYSIETWKHNVSHDLRLLYGINDNLNYFKATSTYPHIVNLHTELNKLKYKHEFGTEQMLNSGLPAKIANVSDAEVVFRQMIKSPKFGIANNAYTSAATVSGDLSVYLDGRNMRYISIP